MSREDYERCIAWLLVHAVCSNALAILWLLWAKDHFKYWRMCSDIIADLGRYLYFKGYFMVRKENSIVLN
jgi:hypothetical protein